MADPMHAGGWGYCPEPSDEPVWDEEAEWLAMQENRHWASVEAQYRADMEELSRRIDAEMAAELDAALAAQETR